MMMEQFGSDGVKGAAVVEESECVFGIVCECEKNVVSKADTRSDVDVFAIFVVGDAMQ